MGSPIITPLLLMDYCDPITWIPTSKLLSGRFLPQQKANDPTVNVI
jgi:hypothetical protein